MSDSLRELRDALLKADGIINSTVVKLEPRLIDRSEIGYSR